MGVQLFSKLTSLSAPTVSYLGCKPTIQALFFLSFLDNHINTGLVRNLNLMVMEGGMVRSKDFRSAVQVPIYGILFF